MKFTEYTPYIILLVFGLFTIKRFGLVEFAKLKMLSREKRFMLKNFFSKHFEYFNKLSDNEREQFVIRAYRLINNIKINGRDGFEVTTDIKFFVIAAYVQLTFGFKYYLLPKFHTIWVYPDAYKNKLTGNMHYGEVNPKGLIVLSWKKLLKGHEITNDAINLGLHEMAHALMHTIIHSNDHENGLDPFLRDIVRLSRYEMEKIKSGENHLFRRYAGSNIYEFFAIAIENFFEIPEKLNNELPKLYKYLVLLLKQDPIKGNYKITKQVA